MKVALPLWSLILFSTITASLGSYRYFLSPFDFSYIGCSVMGALSVPVAALLLWYSKRTGTIYAWPVWVYWLYIGFVGLQSFIIGGPEPTWLYTHGGLLLCQALLAKKLGEKFPHYLSIGLLILCFGESVLCFLQHLQWVSSGRTLYEVSGSLPNPNMTALFLAMASPWLLYVHSTNRKIIQYAALLALGLSCGAIVLLKCRTAIIGVICATAVYYQIKQSNSLYKNCVTQLKRWGIPTGLAAVCLVLLSGFTAAFLYNAEKASSDSRLMVWRISGTLIQERPWFGHGFVQFERVYNLAQSAYFASGCGNTSEQFSAAHIKIAYNDYIQQLVETGVVGTVLYIAFLGSLLISIRRVGQITPAFQAAYAAVVCFAVMSCFNSIIYIASAFVLFIVSAGLLCGITLSKAAYISDKWYKLALIGLFTLGCGLFVWQCKNALAMRQLKLGTELIAQQRYKQAIKRLNPLQGTLKTYSEYWRVYGSAFEGSGQYELALQQYKLAAKYSTNPKLYLDMSYCHARLKRYGAALKDGQIAANIAPNRIQPNYALMKIYLSTQDSANARKMAQIILDQSPKGISKEAGTYKEEARKLLNISN